LVLVNPAGNPDPGLPQSWRPSAAVGGSPAAGDTTTYAAWKTTQGISSDTADTDQDGLNSFHEYAHGSSPGTPDVRPQLRAMIEAYQTGTPPATESYFTLTYRRNLVADDVDYRLEQSTVLAAGYWLPAAVTQVSEVVVPGSTSSQVTFRTTTPASLMGNRCYFRLRVVPR
jgi:hypothetical protein